MKTSLPIAGIPRYDPANVQVLYYTTVNLGNYIENDYRENVGSHCGVDIDATKYPNGQTDVFAVIDGSVFIAKTNDPSYGNYLVLKHENCPSFQNPNTLVTYYSCYLHLSSLAVAQGQTVTTGAKIGVSGSTGNSTAAHLHFQIDTHDAPFHPYWPFSNAEMVAAGYSSYTDAVNGSLNIDRARQYTISPMTYIQTYLGTAGGTLFTDIANDDADYAAIKYLKEHNVIQGYPDGSFKPENPINRAELLKMAFVAFAYPVRTFNASSFSDVKTNDWFFGYTETAFQDGIIRGYGDGTFKPGNNITKAEALKVLLNTKKIAVPTSVTNSYFSDVAVDAWYTPFINTAYERNIIDHSSKFDPNLPVTRRLISRWIYRMVS